MGWTDESVASGYWWQTTDLSTLVLALFPVWLLGACIGLLLPRPRWLETSSKVSTYWLASPSGVLLRRFTLAVQGIVIAREIWRHYAVPGTFHAIAAALWSLVQGDGFALQLPDMPSHVKALIEDSPDVVKSEVVPGTPVDIADWHVTEADLEFFKDRVERDVELPGVSNWQHMTDLKLDTLTYSAWRRRLADGKTEYKSVTVADNATAQEFMDFYLDDPSRHTWDTMISDYNIVEGGPSEQRCQVVHWLRTFPFSFISQREYVIGRRVWQQDGALYGITKAINHPKAPPVNGIVRMDVFYSMWRSRTIPDPKDSSRPACETVLLHHEQFKISEKLSRFAVRHGMTGFVKKMGPAVMEFVAARRQRVDAFASDPQAYGVSSASPPLARTNSVFSQSESITSDSSSGGSDVSFCCRLSHRQPKKPKPEQRKKRLQALIMPVLTAGAAVAVGCKGRSVS